MFSYEDLRSLINQLDITDTGGVTMLYSGGNSSTIVDTLVEQGENLRTIGETEAADRHWKIALGYKARVGYNPC